MSTEVDLPLPPPRHDAAHSPSMKTALLAHSPAAAHAEQCGDLSGGPSSSAGFLVLGLAGLALALALALASRWALHLPGHRSFISAGLLSHSPSSTQLWHSSRTQLWSATPSCVAGAARFGSTRGGFSGRLGVGLEVR
eukprot:scaffold71136_cov67-Phaeocystis_antarctica.AAC.6